MKLKTRWVITSSVFFAAVYQFIDSRFVMVVAQLFFVYLVNSGCTLGLVGWFFSFRRPVSDKELKHAEAISITDREIANI